MGAVVCAADESVRVDGVFARYLVDVHARGANAGLAAGLAQRGIATFEGIRTSSELLRLARSIGTPLPHRDTDARGVTTLAATRTGTRRPGHLGFTSEALFPHTDGSSVASPPPLVMLACEVPALQGGASLTVDACVLYKRLRVEMPAALAALMRPDSARFGGEGEYCGSVFETLAPDRPDAAGRVSVRFRWDGLAEFTPAVAAALPMLLELIREEALGFKLDAGQGYVLQNSRWLHGRTEFNGQRKVHRVLISPHGPSWSEIDAIPFGFLPPCST